MLDQVNALKKHPYRFLFDLTADPKGDLTLADVEKIIKNDKLCTVSDASGKGIANFDTIIEKLFDQVESKIAGDLQKLIKEVVEKYKRRYFDYAVNDIVSDFSTKLTISQRNDILSRPEFSKCVFTDPYTKREELKFSPDMVDVLIQLQLAIAQALDG